MLNILMGHLPQTVEVSEKEYPINWDFRTGIQFESIARNTELGEQEKIWMILNLYYPKVPEDLQGAMEKVLWFYRCGKTGDEPDKKQKRYRQKDSDAPAYAFLQDAPYIYADFKNQYGMDLAELKEPLHWWKFSALFESLGEETKIGKIMYYRKVRITGMPKDRRAFINEMKKLYRIQNVDSGNHRMTLEERNRRWRNYVISRYEKK